jgi:site-specific recombinase XerD
MFISKNKKTRGRYYVYYFDENGRRKSVTTGSSYKNDALLFLIAFANKINEINATIPSSKPLKMFSELEYKITEYVSNNYRKGTAKIYKNVLKNFVKIFGDKPLNQITNKEIEYYKSYRLKEVTNTTVNIDLNTLNSIFNIGLKFGWCLHNPVKGIKKIKIPQKERLSMNDKEIEKLLREVKKDTSMKNIILFGLYTGCRLNEILNLQWMDIDLREKVIYIRNKEDFKTKTGKTRLIPFGEKLYSVINKMVQIEKNVIKFHSPEAYLFSKPDNRKYSDSYTTHRFKHYIRKAGLPEKFHFHALRHTFITNCIKSGINVNYVQALAGHSELKTTLGYTYIGIEDLKKAILAVN